MNLRSRGAAALTGAVLLAALISTVPGSSSAAPPAGPGYECSTQASAPSANPTKIMIAGDSITNASAGDYTWPYWLWRDQVDRGANIEFVGRFQDTIVANTLVQGSRAYLDCDFDQDDEARPGVKLWTSKAQSSGTYSFGTAANANPSPVVPYYSGYDTWMQGAADTWDPDIIVLFAGANDLAFTTGEPTSSMSPQERADFVIGKLKGVIDEARAGNPGVDIVLTTVPSTTTGNLYNAQLPTVVSQKNGIPSASEKVVLATIPSWSDHSWDGLHPDAVGEVSIAAAIDDALHAINPALFARPAVLATPAIGPRFPAALSAATAGDNKVQLDWTYPPGADRARVWARNANGGAWQLKADLVKATLRDFYPSDGTATCSVPCTTYTVTGLSGGTTYEFKVQLGKGHAIAPESAVAPEVEQVVATGPVTVGKVSIPTATAGIHAVKLDWPAMDGATIYDVRWHVIGSTTYSTTTATSPTRTITGLVAGRKYGFGIRARNATSTGAWSDERQAIPKANALAAGKKPVLTQLSGRRIKAAWGASTGANKYQVQRRLVGGAWKVVATTTARTLTSGALVKGKTYEFRIRPYDGDVGGAYSPTTRRKVS